MKSAPNVDREDIQGIVLHGYRRERLACYHLLTFGGGEPRRALARLVSDVSSADEPRGLIRTNLALTASGLGRLGMGEQQLLQFSREFRQGMAHPERSLALGDVADESPEHWEFGGPNTPVVDALWMTFAASAAKLEESTGHQERTFERFGLSYQRQDAALAPDPEDHLGDQLNAPALDARAGKRRLTRAALGDILLGARDSSGERVLGPLAPVKAGRRPLPAWLHAQNALDFGRNGSYLVLRKLELEALAQRDEAALREHVWRARGADQAPARPLIRRSRPYGPSEDSARGLWFMAVNADIRRHFELVQQCYFNAALPGAAYAVDPFVGRAPHRANKQRMTRLRGGAYFFLPSLRALNYLAESGG